jgi:hypothetical protein
MNTYRVLNKPPRHEDVWKSGGIDPRDFTYQIGRYNSFIADTNLVTEKKCIFLTVLCNV